MLKNKNNIITLVYKSNVRLIIIFYLLTFNSCKNQEKKQLVGPPSSPISLTTVSTNVIRPNVFHIQTISNGKVTSVQKSELRFKTTERIASIKVKNGQKIHKGRLLATLDNDLLANKLSKAKLDVAKANSKLQEEMINYSINDTVTSVILKELHIKSGYLEAKNALENYCYSLN